MFIASLGRMIGVCSVSTVNKNYFYILWDTETMEYSSVI